MHSLYWRIFLAFWAALALILVGTVTVAVNATSHRTERPWVQRGQLYAQAARAFEAGGPDALKAWLQGLAGEPAGRTYIVGPDGHEMLGRPLPPILRATGARSGRRGCPGGDRPGRRRPGAGRLRGATYHVVVGPVRDGPRLFGELELPGVPLSILLIAIAASAAVCLLLARYLVAPVDRLRLATRQLAGGDLNVRVLPALKGRKDDLGLLAQDLDAMAERLRQLLEGKQQLLRDVSHELRSPLARLQLALSLARRDPGATERHLARAGLEADRLEQLIARTLQLVRLERPLQTARAHRCGHRRTAAQHRLRGRHRSRRARLHGGRAGAERTALAADRELLRSAFENVIRNAVRYSPVGAGVKHHRPPRAAPSGCDRGRRAR